MNTQEIISQLEKVVFTGTDINRATDFVKTVIRDINMGCKAYPARISKFTSIEAYLKDVFEFAGIDVKIDSKAVETAKFYNEEDGEKIMQAIYNAPKNKELEAKEQAIEELEAGKQSQITLTKEQILSRIENARKNGTLELKVNGFPVTESIFIKALGVENKVVLLTDKNPFDGAIYKIDLEYTKQAPARDKYDSKREEIIAPENSDIFENEQEKQDYIDWFLDPETDFSEYSRIIQEIAEIPKQAQEEELEELKDEKQAQEEEIEELKATIKRQNKNNLEKTETILRLESKIRQLEATINKQILSGASDKKLKELYLKSDRRFLAERAKARKYARMLFSKEVSYKIK